DLDPPGAQRTGREPLGDAGLDRPGATARAEGREVRPIDVDALEDLAPSLAVETDQPGPIGKEHGRDCVDAVGVRLAKGVLAAVLVHDNHGRRRLDDRPDELTGWAIALHEDHQAVGHPASVHSSPMRYRTFGQTGLSFSTVSMGCNRLGD